jgi:hypothetical protein
MAPAAQHCLARERLWVQNPVSTYWKVLGHRVGHGLRGDPGTPAAASASCLEM